MSNDYLDIAWAAGFLDGEGCFRPYRKQRTNGIQWSTNISAGQTRPAPIWKLHDLFGGGISRHISKNADYWRVTGAENASVLLSRLIPFLTVKQSEARVLAEYVQTFGHFHPTAQQVARREEVFASFADSTPPLTPDEIPHDQALAWCGGFLDAEGCFSLNKVCTAPRPGIRSVSVGAYQMHYRAPLIRLRETFGVGRVSERPNCNGAYKWVVGRAAHVIEVIEKVEPHLVVKHVDAQIVHDFSQEMKYRGKRCLPPDTLARRLALIEQMEEIRA